MERDWNDATYEKILDEMFCCSVVDDSLEWRPYGLEDLFYPEKCSNCDYDAFHSCDGHPVCLVCYSLSAKWRNWLISQLDECIADLDAVQVR